MALIRCNNESAKSYNTVIVTNTTGTILTSGTPQNVIKGNLYVAYVNGSNTDSFTFVNGDETITDLFTSGGQHAAIAFIAKSNTVTYTGNVGIVRIESHS